MTISEEISETADSCFAIALRTSIHGHKFAKRVFVADFQISWLARVFEILRLLTDRAIGVKFVSLAGARWPLQSHMMLEPAILPEHNLGADHAIRSDDRSGSNFRARV